MDSRFKTSNIVALLIAVSLIATGFALNFIHQQSESAEKQESMTNPETSKQSSATEDSL
jgi:hypothetical protein